MKYLVVFIRRKRDIVKAEKYIKIAEEADSEKIYLP